MKIRPFEIERYFAKYEFSAQFLLSSSECSGLAQSEILSWADEETKSLWDNLVLGYTESLGLPLLRQEIAKLYTDLSSDEIMVVVPEEGIFIAMNALLSKGDHVICTWPGYQSLYEIAESLDCELTKWQPKEEEGWKFDVDSLEQQLRPSTKLIVLNFPHNPTGYLPPKDDFQRIIEIARKHDVYIFSDEMYRLLEFNPEDRLPPASETYEKAVSLFGMSKTFGMAGVRLGWLTTKDKELYQNMAVLKDYTTICASAPSELLSLIALRSKQKILDRHLDRISRNLALLDEFFRKHDQFFSWTRPKAGTIGFPKMLFNENSLKFSERAINDAGIMILPSTVYAYDDKHFRLGFGHEDMPQVLAEFEKYLQTHPPQ